MNSSKTLKKISNCLKLRPFKQNHNRTLNISSMCLKLLAIPVLCAPQEKENDTKLISKLNHEFLVKQSAVVLVSSVTSLLDSFTSEILDCYEDYTQSIEEVLYLHEERQMVVSLGNAYLEDQVWEKIIAEKSSLEEVRKKSRNLELQITYITNLANSTAEVSFGAGADYAAIAVNERLFSVLAEIEGRKKKLQKLEQELLETETKLIKSTDKKQETEAD